MKFLLDDLNLKENKETMAKIFNKEVPYTNDDVVVINIKVVGEAHDGRYEEKTYNRQIYGTNGHSAIQVTTASGICAVIFLYAKGILRGNGFMKQEDVGFNDFLYSNYGRIYT
jgi:saccharopine dehydrogenase-like NADP-dependent oxidoreductase